MASRRAIISGAKSIPGGSRPTPANQGLSPYTGQGGISPLAAQLDSGGSWGGAYQGHLPRPPETFTQGAFGPFSPILPVPVDAPEEGANFPDPRLFQYDVGWNLPAGQPGSEGVKLADFNTLRSLADLYSVARSCIQLRKSEIRGIEWDIMPSHEATKAMRGDRDAMKDFGERRAEAVRFFRRPDPDYFSWNTWIDALLEEVFVFDALSVLFRQKWAKGKGRGLLGSDLDSLSLINGPTIRPLLDLQGGKPRPPAPAYQQYLYGVPRCDLMTLVTERDIETGRLSGSEMNAYRADQLLYLPMSPRRWTPYGFPPIERALVPVMSGLQKQGYQLDYFREGTVPAVYVSPGGVNANMTPNQIRELQDALNAIAGDPAWKHKIIVLPADSHVMPQRGQQLADQFDEIVMSQVCMAFDVQPMELGIMPKVSTSVSPGASNQMAKATQNIHERKATKPTLTFLADIMNAVLQDVCNQGDMRFVFEGLEEQEDEATKTTMIITQIGAGLRSIDEGREELQLQPWGLPETSDPGWATMQGWVPLTEAAQARQTQSVSGPLLELEPGATPVQPTQPAAAPDQPGPTAGAGAKPAKKPSAGPVGNAGQSPGHDAAESTDANTGASKAAKTGAAARHQARRDSHVQSAADTVTQRLRGLVDSYQQGDLAAPHVLDEAIRVLAEGYRSVMATAVGDARRDHGLSKTVRAALAKDDADGETDGPIEDDSYDQVSGEATVRAEGQRSYLMGLLAAVAAGTISSAMLGARLDLYGQTLTGAYNAAYGKTLQASGDYTITWRLGGGSHCRNCLARDGKTYTFHSLPGWPGDGGFSGPGSICAGGQNCKCSLEYSEAGTVLATAGNPGQADSVGYYSQQLQDITARREAADQARQDFLSTVPDPARARAQTRDDIRQELADHANVRIRATGGYGGVSVEPADIPAGDVADQVLLGASKTRAVLSELDALARHMRKGRLISTWEPRHIDQAVLARISEHIAKGLDVDAAIAAAKAMRRVDTNGQEYWDAQATPAGPPVPAGGGGPTVIPHDASGIPVPDGQATAKGASDLSDPNPVDAEHILNQLRSNYPEKSLAWVKGARWIGPVEIPLDRIDFDDVDGWAATHDTSRVADFAKRIRKGKEHLNPVIAVQEPGDDKIKVVDGHHRTLAYRQLDKPVKAYVGFVDSQNGPWTETHLYQVHQGDHPQNKSAGVEPIAAGVAVLAADSGRVLMLQRAITGNDPAAGCWEFPGGCLEPGEAAVVAAQREWSEETGCLFPAGMMTGGWASANGVYRGFVWTVPSEDAVPIFDGRDRVTNPDDPDGDLIEALAWWDPGHLQDCPALRPELAGDLAVVLQALGVRHVTQTSAAPAVLLGEIADALNRLRDLGLRATLRYDAVMTDHGFVLPETDGTWAVRLKISDPQYAPRGDPDDD